MTRRDGRGIGAQMLRWGIDLGGTKTEIIGLDDAGETRLRRRVSTPKDDYEGIVRAIVGLVEAAETETGERGTIGIGTPGSASPKTGLMRNANTVVLNGKPLHRDIEAAFGREVRLANDANCFALSEAVDGSGTGHVVVFGVILGTGCGGGVVVNQHILEGANGIAGEWGHSPLPWPSAAELPGPECYCGKRGCIETWISGTGLENDYERATGERDNGPNIVAKATRGDAEAEEVLQHFEERVGRCLSTVINLLDPHVIVLGGGASNIGRLYERLPEVLPRWVFSDHVSTPVVRAKHGDSSGVRGAAWLWGRDTTLAS
jgi:fructokinase